MKKHAHFALLRPLSIFLLFSLGITLQLTAQQTEVYTISHDNTRIRDMVFGQNGKALVVKSGDEVLVNAKGLVTSPSIHVWDMDGRRKTMAIADREYGRASCISHDGSMVAFREKGNINVMDLASK